MSSAFRFSRVDLASLGKKSGWFLGLGFLLMILGAFAIGAASFTTLISVILLGFIVSIGGIVMTVDTFNAWWGQWKIFFLHLVIGVLYLVAGALLIKHPASASVSLTLLLGLFYFIVGIFRIFQFISLRQPNWIWGFFSGLISLILGVLILSSWPGSSLYIIGLFVGIDLLFTGWFYLMVGLSARRWV